jgi:ribosome-binding protein aMBF1 (putative translation factor)
MYQTGSAEKKINWLFSSENQFVTENDFHKMVREAEQEKGMSLSEYKEKMSLWWESRL